VVTAPTARSLPPLPERASDRYAGACSARTALRAIGGRWTTAVVGRLARGGARFGTLRESLGDGVSAKVLAAELRRLDAAGVVARDATGPGVAYRLTAHGRALVPLLDALGAWAASAPGPAQHPHPDARRSAA
jgi:DNA-binding HxlR family transcriptional regulator